MSNSNNRGCRGKLAAWWLVGLLCWLASPALGQIAQGPPRVRNVYIPADQLKLVFDNASKGVLMPREKILALWDEARRVAPQQATPPADVVVSQATYEAQLADHELRITGRVRITKLQTGWQSVDLPLGGMAIESATIDKQPARFGLKGDNTLFLMLEKEGRFDLELTMSAPLASKGGDLATTLKLPPTPASEILLRLQKDRQLQVGETVLQPESVKDNQQQFRIAVDRSGLVPLVISERSAGGNRSPLVLVNSRSIARIEPAGLRWELSLDLDVCARATDTFQIHLPDSVDLTEVEASELSQWTTQKQGGGVTALKLAFRKPVLGRRVVRVVGLASIPAAAEWNIPTARVPEAASHVGQVVVYCWPSLRAEIGSLAGIRPERLPAVELASSAPAGKPLKFAFWDENFRLPLRVSERRRTMQASIATLVEVTRTSAALRSSMTLQPRHAPVFDVEVLLPRVWEVTSVSAGGKPVQWESSPQAGKVSAADASLQAIRFDLAKPLLPGQSLEIALSAGQHPSHWLEQDERPRELPVPDLRLPGADEVEGTLLVRGLPEIELSALQLSNDLQPMAAEGSQNASSEPSGTVLQYRYQDNARLSGRILIQTKPAKVSAETLAFVRLDRGKLDVHYQLDLHIRQGTMRHVCFTLPAAVGEKLQIVPVDSAVRVIEQRHSPQEGKTDLNRWTVVFDRPVTGDLTLALDLGQTCGTAAGESATETNARVAIPVLALQNVSRQSGMVAVEAASDQQIDCQPKDLRELDPAEVLKPKAYKVAHRIVAAYQYRRLPYGLAISATRHQPGAVLTALCESAEITSVPGDQGRTLHQARFRLRSLNLPHVPVVLPEGADLWSAMLDNSPIEVRRKQNTYLVPLPAAQDHSESAMRDLTLLYETSSPPLATGNAWERLRPQSISQVAPELAIATLNTTWRFFPPRGTTVVSSAGDFKPEASLTRPTLASSVADTIAHHSTSSLTMKFAGLIAAGIFVGIFALSRSAKGCCISLVQFLIAITIIGVLIALLLPATQSARECSRRAMCSNQLRQISLALLNYEEQYKQFPPAAIGPHNVPRERQFSWLVAILPYLEQDNLYKQLRLDLPWDHPLNAALLQVPLRMVLCPSDPAPTATSEGLAKTSYVAVTGAEYTDGSGNPRGIIGFDRGLCFDEIVDGASNTIMVGEVTDGGPWFAAGYGTARPIDSWIANKTWSHHADSGNFVFADGSVQSLDANANPQTLRYLATAQGRETISDPEFSSDSRGVVAESAMPPAFGRGRGASSAVKKEEPKAEASRQFVRQMPVANKPAGSAAVPQPVVVANALPTQPTATPATPTAADAPAMPTDQPRTAAGGRARLSLAMAIETQGRREVRFRHEGGSGELAIELQDSDSANALEWSIAAALLLIAWLARNAAGSRRATAVVIGVALPIGVAGLVPLACMPLLDGVLLGSLGAGCLWMLLRLIAALKASMTASVAVVAIGVGLWLAAGTSVAAETTVEQKAPRDGQVDSSDLTLFIPYEPGREQPMGGKQAYLPHNEFLRLWKLAHPDKPAQAAPNVPTVVSFAEYTGRLDNDTARFDGRLVVDHLVDGWTPVALPLGKVAMEKIEINGRPATLAGDASDRPTIYLDKAGPQIIDVRFGVPASRLGATGQITVPLQPVSSGRLRFELPSEDIDVEVIGSAGGWRRHAAANGRGASVDVPLGAAKELSIRWQPRRAEAREGHLISVDQAVLVELADSGVHFRSKLYYRIQQGAVTKLRLQVPADIAIQGVQGAEVADWSIESGEAAKLRTKPQQLVVALKRPLSSGTEIDIQAFRRDRLAAGAVDIHTVEPLDVVRETGRVAIGCAGHLGVRLGKAEGLDQIDRAGLNLPQQPREGCSLLWAYRYAGRPWHLQFQVERRPSRVEVSDQTAVSVTAGQTLLRSKMAADIAGAPILSFSLRLPASLRLTQVRVPAGADWFVGRDDQCQRLKVELAEPAVGKLDLEISGTLPRDAGQAEFAVPGVVVEGVQVERGQLAIYLDDDIEAVLANAGAARPIDPTALQSQTQSAGNRRVRYAFQYDAPPKDLRLRLSSATSRLNGDVTTVVSVREGAVAYVSEVNFEIQQAAKSRFRVVTPEWLGDDVEVRGEQIRQIHSKLAGGHRTWEIELQQPVRGTYCLHLTQTLPLPDDGTVPAAMIRPLDVERSRSHLVLENGTGDEIAATTTTGVAPVPIAAVSERLAANIRRQAVAAYRVVDDAAALVWQRRVREQEAGLIASISLCDLTTVIHADGRYRARAAYNIRNFTLQFLELELPKGCEVWSVHVSGQPVHPAVVQRDGRPITLLPLEKTSIGDFSSKVIVIYAGDLGKPLDRWSQVEPPAPRILNNVPISRTLWTVLLPSEYSVGLIKGASNVEEVGAEYQQEERNLSVLDELRQMVQVASSKGKSAAQTKARSNLKQVGLTLDNYTRQDALFQQTEQTVAKNAADVKQQAQQLQSDIGRLEEVQAEAKSFEGDTSTYFVQSQRGPMVYGNSFAPDSGEERIAGERRGDMRKQAVDQLERLQNVDAKGYGGMGFSGRGMGARGLASNRKLNEEKTAGTSTGQLALKLDVTPVGTAYHFRKLHGDPRLALQIRHEELDRWLIAAVWLVLCLTLAIVAIRVLGRSDSLARARNRWPWLAMLAGIAWLFLLPAGILGLGLLLVASCVLITRFHKQSASCQPQQPPVTHRNG